MLSELSKKHNPLSATLSPQVDVPENDSTEVSAGLEMETEAAATSEAVHDPAVIDDKPAGNALDEVSHPSTESVAMSGPLEAGTDRDTADKITDVATNEHPDTSLQPGASAGSEDTAIDKGTTDESANKPADVATGNSAELPDEPAAELGTTTSIGTTQVDTDNAHATSDAAADSSTANAHRAVDAVTGAMAEDQAMDTYNLRTNVAEVTEWKVDFQTLTATRYDIFLTTLQP